MKPRVFAFGFAILFSGIAFQAQAEVTNAVAFPRPGREFENCGDTPAVAAGSDMVVKADRRGVEAVSNALLSARNVLRDTADVQIRERLDGLLLQFDRDSRGAQPRAGVFQAGLERFLKEGGTARAAFLSVLFSDADLHEPFVRGEMVEAFLEHWFGSRTIGLDRETKRFRRADDGLEDEFGLLWWIASRSSFPVEARLEAIATASTMIRRGEMQESGFESCLKNAMETIATDAEREDGKQACNSSIEPPLVRRSPRKTPAGRIPEKPETTVSLPEKAR